MLAVGVGVVGEAYRVLPGHLTTQDCTEFEKTIEIYIFCSLNLLISVPCSFRAYLIRFSKNDPTRTQQGPLGS